MSRVGNKCAIVSSAMGRSAMRWPVPWLPGEGKKNNTKWEGVTMAADIKPPRNKAIGQSERSSSQFFTVTGQRVEGAWIPFTSLFQSAPIPLQSVRPCVLATQRRPAAFSRVTTSRQSSDPLCTENTLHWSHLTSPGWAAGDGGWKMAPGARKHLAGGRGEGLCGAEGGAGRGQASDGRRCIFQIWHDLSFFGVDVAILLSR